LWLRKTNAFIIVESRWDKEKKQSRIHVVKHLERVVEEEGKEKLIPSQLKFDSVDHAYPVGELALFWKIAEEFEVQKNISKAIGRDEKDSGNIWQTSYKLRFKN